MPRKPHIQLTGILTGIPHGTAKPHGKYVYQKTKKGLGNIPGDKTKRQQVRRWVQGTITHTPQQVVNRGQFAQGVAAWHVLTDAEKESWRAPGRVRQLNRFQAYMRAWMMGAIEPAPDETLWDNGASVWDMGESVWNIIGASAWDAGATTWDGGESAFDVTGDTIWDGGATAWDGGESPWHFN